MIYDYFNSIQAAALTSEVWKQIGSVSYYSYRSILLTRSAMQPAFIRRLKITYHIDAVFKVSNCCYFEWKSKANIKQMKYRHTATDIWKIVFSLLLLLCYSIRLFSHLQIATILIVSVTKDICMCDVAVFALFRLGWEGKTSERNRHREGKRRQGWGREREIKGKGDSESERERYLEAGKEGTNSAKRSHCYFLEAYFTCIISCERISHVAKKEQNSNNKKTKTIWIGSHIQLSM